MSAKHVKKGFDKKIAIVFLALFVIFTALVKLIDVKPIGPNGSKVGFASINGAIFSALGYSPKWYAVAEAIGYIALATCVFFALTGLFQLISRRSFKAVDKELYVLAGLYVVTIALYVLFDHLPINCRPVLVNGVLEPSYPSSHTLLSLVVFVSAAMNRQKYSNKRGLSFTGIISIALAVLCIVARLLSGLHWFTDIIGAILLSASLLFFYMAALEKFDA